MVTPVRSAGQAPIAQSAERLHGKEKVNGSIPFGGSHADKAKRPLQDYLESGVSRCARSLRGDLWCQPRRVRSSTTGAADANGWMGSPQPSRNGAGISASIAIGCGGQVFLIHVSRPNFAAVRRQYILFLVLIGVLLPNVVGRLSGAWHWSTDLRRHQRLRPLWQALYQAAPEIALVSPRTGPPRRHRSAQRALPALPAGHRDPRRPTRCTPLRPPGRLRTRHSSQPPSRTRGRRPRRDCRGRRAVHRDHRQGRRSAVPSQLRSPPDPHPGSPAPRRRNLLADQGRSRPARLAHRGHNNRPTPAGLAARIIALTPADCRVCCQLTASAVARTCVSSCAILCAAPRLLGLLAGQPGRAGRLRMCSPGQVSSTGRGRSSGSKAE